jgi:hypothetical protein
MAVDLGDLVETLRREVSQPGAEETTFPDANDDTFFGHLQDAFWEARLDGMLEGFVEADGLVSPTNPSADDLTRDLQQLVVLYAGIRIFRNQLVALNTTFRAKAGPVEYETQKSAQVLVAHLKELQNRRNLVLERLSDIGAVNGYYIDAIYERENAIDWGLTYFMGHR